MIIVTCAIIRNEDDEILVVQRGKATDHPLKWEFPGGKVNADETNEEAVIREIREELSMDIIITGQLAAVEHDYGFKKIRLIPFICDTLDELPLLSEHAAFRWINSGELPSIDFSGADITVAQNYLARIIYDTNVTGGAVQNPASSIPGDEELQSMIDRMMSIREVEWIATSAIENSALFGKLIEYSFSDDKKLSFHASWTLTKVCDRSPEIIYPYISTLIDRMADLDNESVLRSFLRIISLSDIAVINEKQHGILADKCFNLLRSGFSAIAVKAYSMEILYKLVLIYPELRNELTATINLLQPDGSAGILARGRQILKKLAGL